MILISVVLISLVAISAVSAADTDAGILADEGDEGTGDAGNGNDAGADDTGNGNDAGADDTGNGNTDLSEKQTGTFKDLKDKIEIAKIDKTNLSYIEPHKIIIKEPLFLAFNYSNEIFIENLSNKIKLSELEDYLKTN